MWVRLVGQRLTVAYLKANSLPLWLATKASPKDHLHFYRLYFQGISNMKTKDHVQCHILKMGTHRCHVELQGHTKWPYRLLWLGVGNGGTLCQVNRDLLFKVPRALLVWGQLPKKGRLRKALTSKSVEKRDVDCCSATRLGS